MMERLQFHQAYWYEFFKRILDVIVALILMVLFLPFWVIVPILIVFDSGMPILFKHRRLGKDGQEFFLYKFRSMVRDADDILHKHDQKLLEEFKNGDWKIKNDPRITKVGKVLYEHGWTTRIFETRTR